MGARSKTRYTIVDMQKTKGTPEEVLARIVARPGDFIMYKTMKEIKKWHPIMSVSDRVFKISTYVQEIKIKE